MDDRLLSLILPHLEHWGYFVILFAAFLETSAFLGLLVPGETIVVIAGLLAGTGNLDLIKVMASASVGAILGDTVGYFIGCRFGESFFRRYGRYILFKPRYLDQAQRFFADHGGKTVFLARFVGYLRAFAPVVAGMSRMPYHWFLLANVCGAIAWASTFSLIGYFVGGNWETIAKYLGRAGMAAAALVIAAVVVYVRLIKPRRRARKSHESPKA